MSPLGLGIVGCGHVAEVAHLPALARVPSVEVVAVFDADRSRAARAAGGATVHGSLGALVADPRVEAVAVLVPPSDHLPVAAAALDAGRHVLVEKPLALRTSDAEELVARATVAGVVAMTGFNLRRLAVVRRAREVLSSGALGELEALRSVVTSARRFDASAPEWRRRRELGGGSFVEQGVHHFDLWRHLLDDEVETVVAFGQDADAGAAVTARMRGGVLVQSTFSERTTPVHSVEVFGREACLRLSLTRFDGLELLPVEGGGESAPATRGRALASTLRALPRGLAELRRGGVFARSYVEQWEDFAAAVRSGRPASPDFADGLRALEIALAAARSADEGRPVGVGADLAAR
ncbi:MAG TPA: Gfo/Idh/MocA family oxidoreductase [Solirubrobacteraceae bacterium]|jgi:predicted dehydrogenase